MRARTLAYPLLCLSLLAASSWQTPLPPIPATVYSRYGPVPVEMVKVVECPDSSGTTPVGVIACYNSKSRRVTIADTLSPRWAQFVLGHEQCHIAFRDVGAVFQIREEEEKICWVMARWRLGDLETR
jgi:hypothetical protein